MRRRIDTAMTVSCAHMDYVILKEGLGRGHTVEEATEAEEEHCAGA